MELAKLQSQETF